VLGGGAWFEEFLEPSFAVAEEIAPIHGSHSLLFEYSIMGISVLIAIAGILWARAWYIKNPEAPKKLATRFKGVYQLILNKYYVDEAYNFTVVETTLGTADGLWKFFDVKIVDGLVNGVAALLVWLGSVFRRIQTGLVSNYALMMTIGIVIIIGYLVWK